METLKIGEIVTGIVTGVETYGIFVKVDDYTGLIHISEISESFIKNVKDYAIIGDKIKAKILDLDENKHQLKLSIKELETPHKKSRREKIKETTTGFSSLEKNLESWIVKKMQEIS